MSLLARELHLDGRHTVAVARSAPPTVRPTVHPTFPSRARVATFDVSSTAASSRLLEPEELRRPLVTPSQHVFQVRAATPPATPIRLPPPSPDARHHGARYQLAPSGQSVRGVGGRPSRSQRGAICECRLDGGGYRRPATSQDLSRSGRRSTLRGFARPTRQARGFLRRRPPMD